MIKQTKIMEHKRFANAKQKVKYLLENDHRARNDDLWLTIKYIQEYHPEARLFVDYEQLSDLPSLETIRRVRAKIQNEDKELMPTERVKRKRRKKEEVWASNITKW